MTRADKRGLSRYKRGLPLATLTVAAATSLVACGSSRSSSASGPKPSVSAAPSGSTAQAGGVASGTPIQVGFANMTSGAVSYPSWLQSANAAVDYINNQLGGVHGRPLKLVPCDLQNSVQAAQACGQQFASNPSIPFGILTSDFFSDQGLIAAMQAANKPILGAVSITPSDATSKDVYWVYSSNSDIFGAYASVLKASGRQGVKHVTFINSQGDQSSAGGLALIKSQLAGTGIDITAESVPASEPDFIAPLTAGKVSSDSALVDLALSTTGCLNVAKDLNQLGVHPKLVITSLLCISPEVLKSNAQLFKNWYFVNVLEQPFSNSPTNPPDVTQFINTWNKYVKPGPVSSIPPEAPYGYGVVMTAYNILNSVSDPSTLTASAISNAIVSYKGHVTLSTANLACPSPTAAEPALCNHSVVWYTNNNGELALVTPPGSS